MSAAAVFCNKLVIDVVFVGEVSESQKQELEQYQATVKRQEAELVEVRQQLAKLSEIVDRQTDDMKQLNIEAKSVSLPLHSFTGNLLWLSVWQLMCRCSTM